MDSDRSKRADVVGAIEVILVALATAVTFWLGVTYHIAARLDAVSLRQGAGFDIADLGPGMFVLATGLAIMSVRRWYEAVGDRRALASTQKVLEGSETRYRSLVDMSPAPIVLTDSDARFIFANAAALELLRVPSIETIEHQGFAPFIHPASLPRIMELNRCLLAGEHPEPEEFRLRRSDGTDVVVLLMSAPVMLEGGAGIQSVLQDVTHLTTLADALRQACVDTVEAMARLVEARDPYTAGHQERVALLATSMAQYMGLPEETVRGVRIAGIVHDIGKINIPVEILSKPGRLTDAEFEVIKTHAQRGYEVLRPIEFPWPIAEIVRQHHERLDGSGYPQGLADGAILIESRILAVADTVDAIASNRPYRPALGLGTALQAIRAGKGTLYDERCVEACEMVAAKALATG